MLRFVKFTVLAPFAILFLVFAFANRHSVTVAFDPFASGDIAAFAVTAPLFAVLILAVMFGVVAGGAATWISQGKYRRAARQNRAEAERLRAQIAARPVAGQAIAPLSVSAAP